VQTKSSIHKHTKSNQWDATHSTKKQPHTVLSIDRTQHPHSATQFELTKLHFDDYNLGALYVLHLMFVFNNKFWFIIPLKSSCCGKILLSIQVVLNVWKQFEVQNLNIFGLQRTLAAWFFFIQCPFLIKFFEKVAHTSLFCVVKIPYQSKKLWVSKKHFSRRFSYRCNYCNFSCYFLTFWSHLQTQ